MKASKVKELIKQSLLELEAEKKNTSNSGPMTPEEEEMIKRYEEEEANKYALDKEEPLEEGDVIAKAKEIVAKHKKMTEGEEDISGYDRDKIEIGKANTLARSITSAISDVDPELHVDTFAKGVANVLKREYGAHLFQEFIAALRGNLGSFEDVVSEADSIVESWKRKNLLKESEKPVSDYSERREREKDYTSAKSDKPKKSHTSDSYEESDYIKRRKKEMYEVNDPDKETIESWYHKTNFYIDDLTPEEIEKGIQAHYEEWTAVKDQYGTIEDYFADVEKNGDWY